MNIVGYGVGMSVDCWVRRMLFTIFGVPGGISSIIHPVILLRLSFANFRH